MNKHLNKVFPNAVKLSVLTLGVFLGGHLAAQTDKQSYETIDVVGEKTSPQLKACIRQAAFRVPRVV